MDLENPRLLIGRGPVHTGSQNLSLKYDKDAYVAKLFGGETWVEQKARPNSQHKSHEYFS